MMLTKLAKTKFACLEKFECHKTYKNKILSTALNMIVLSLYGETASELAIESEMGLDCFHPVDLSELPELLSSSKPSACMLYSIPPVYLKKDSL